MANLIADEPQIKHQYLDLGLLQTFMDLIDCNPEDDVLKSIVWCLGNLTDDKAKMGFSAKVVD